MKQNFILSLVIVFFFAVSCNSPTCTEDIKEDCMCTLQYDPVCGCNDKTYGNACEAECHGITEYTKGECE